MARALSEFRRSLRELASELVQREKTEVGVTSTPAGLVKYRQLTRLEHIPDEPVVRELILRTVNQELRAAAIDAASSVDRRMADIVALARAAGLDVRMLLEHAELAQPK